MKWAAAASYREKGLLRAKALISPSPTFIASARKEGSLHPFEYYAEEEEETSTLFRRLSPPLFGGPPFLDAAQMDGFVLIPATSGYQAFSRRGNVPDSGNGSAFRPASLRLRSRAHAL
jgi:hypothetical protein